MARSVKNKKGFKIIAMTPQEAVVKCGFGIYIPSTRHIVLVDDNTNDDITEEPYVYYICVLNRLFSKNTTRNWLKSAIRYNDDVKYELRYHDMYMMLLNK